MQTIFLDVQTTGVNAKRDKVVEIAIIDQNEEILLSTLVNPRKEIPVYARRVHGITNEDVEDSPTFDQVIPYVENICKGKHIVAYNASLHTCFLPTIKPLKVSCAMLRYADRHNYRIGERLAAAAKRSGFNWERASRYRSLMCARACYSVWAFLNEVEADSVLHFLPQQISEMQQGAI